MVCVVVVICACICNLLFVLFTGSEEATNIIVNKSNQKGVASEGADLFFF